MIQQTQFNLALPHIACSNIYHQSAWLTQEKNIVFPYEMELLVLYVLN